MHNERTFKNIEASLDAFKQIIAAQRAHIRAVKYEHDVLAAGYRAVEAAGFKLTPEKSDKPITLLE